MGSSGLIISLIFVGLFSGAFIGLIIFLIIKGIKYTKANYNALMERAKKIDPTVKTIAEAEYVLQKDVAKSVGTNKNMDNKKDEAKKGE